MIQYKIIEGRSIAKAKDGEEYEKNNREKSAGNTV